MMRLLGGLFVATLLGSFLFSRRNKDDESSEERDRRATQNTHNYYQSQNDDKSDRCQPNRSANQNRPHLYQFDDDISKENHLAPRVQKPDSWVGFEAPARSYASPSEIASNDPKVVTGHTQIKASFDQSNVTFSAISINESSSFTAVSFSGSAIRDSQQEMTDKKIEPGDCCFIIASVACSK
jgi:hypothetical protein